MNRLCLLTNDDGPNELLESALRIVSPLFSEVACVIPSTNQSAVSAAANLGKPFRVWAENRGRWLTSGFPADGIRYALRNLPLGRPDVVVSGINRGWNLGRCVVNSGTIGAALEGSRAGISAVCLSAESGTIPTQEWESGVREIVQACLSVIHADWREVIVLSINIPRRLESKRAIFLPVSTVEYDEVYTIEGDESACSVSVSGTNWLPDLLVPDLETLRKGACVINLVPTPWTRPSHELEGALMNAFPTTNIAATARFNDHPS